MSWHGLLMGHGTHAAPAEYRCVTANVQGVQPHTRCFASVLSQKGSNTATLHAFLALTEKLSEDAARTLRKGYLRCSMAGEALQVTAGSAQMRCRNFENADLYGQIPDGGHF